MTHFNKLIRTHFQYGRVQFTQPKNNLQICSVKDSLISDVTNEPTVSNNKVTIFGNGKVGMACALSILAQKISNHICLLGRNKDKLRGEMMDLQHASWFLDSPKIAATTDYAASACSRVCIFAAGVRRKPNETRVSLVDRNAEILKKNIPELVKQSPNAIIVIVTNPVDTMTYLAWKLSGLQMNRVIGTGTSLDSIRFRFFMSQRLNIAPTSCHGYIIGEHGDTLVPVWSAVNIAGVRLKDLNPKIGTSEDPDKWNEVKDQVVKAGSVVNKLKKCTNYGISLCCAAITNAILKNYNTVIPVTTSVCGEHCIDKDIFVSLPCVLNSNGVNSIVRQVLDPTEIKQFQNSVNAMAKLQDSIKF